MGAPMPPTHGAAAMDSCPTPDPELQIDPADLAEARALLAAASITISSFRWKLRDAGYPFREPPDIDRLIARIDRLMFPELQSETRRRRVSVPPPPPSPAAVAAAEALLALTR